jgi:hypothetical protein
MRTGQPIIGRPAWYDRNPTQTGVTYIQNDLAPHITTERWSYTCPSGKKAMVEALDAELCRTAAATTVGRASIYVQLTPSGGTAKDVFNIIHKGNNVGDRASKSIGQSLLMLPGDNLKAMTYDLSTSGTISYCISCKITEFDA